MEEVPSYKVILIGDSSVGKTCLFSKYTKNSCPKAPEPTVGQDFKTKGITLADGKTVKAQVWDTAGQERYRSMMSQNYRKACGALLVYDITQSATFASLKKWIEDVKMQAEPDIVIFLIGNKVDLAANRLVQTSEGEEFAKEQNLVFLETSAVTGANTNEAFEKLLEAIHKQKVAAANVPAAGGSAAAAADGNKAGGVHLVAGDKDNQKKKGCKC